MARYKMYALTDIAGRIYILYRNKIWIGYHRAPREWLKEIRTHRKRSISFAFKVSSLDLAALVWLGIEKEMKPEPIEGSRGAVVELRSGEMRILYLIAYALGCTIDDLLGLAARAMDEAEKIRARKKRISWFEPRLKEESKRYKAHPIFLLFGLSSIYYALRKGVGRNDNRYSRNPSVGKEQD